MLFLAASLISGFLLTFLLAGRLPLVIRCAASVPIGFTVSGLLTLVLAHPFGLSPLTLALSTTLLPAVPALLLRLRRVDVRAELRRGLRRARHLPRFYLPNILLLSVVLILFFRRAAYLSPQGIGTGAIDNFADLAYHIGFIQSFVQADNFPPMHPMYAGARLTYPFLADFHAAALIRAGIPMIPALFWQNVLLTLSLAVLLTDLTARLTRSRVAGALAPWLLFLSGGLGFLLLAPEARETPGGPLQYLTDLPHDFTEWGNLLHWGNSLVYWFATMRGMTLAAPLMIFLWRQQSAVPDDPSRIRHHLLSTGLLTGILPLVHTHTFLCSLGIGLYRPLFGAIPPFAPFVDRIRRGCLFLLSAILPAIPQLWLLFSGSRTRTETFLGLSPGWMAPIAERDPLTYWLLNTGLFLPLLLMVLIEAVPSRSPVPNALRRFYPPFLLFFIAPNIVRFAPWEWDSIKVLYVWFLASVPPVAWMLVRLSRARSFGGKPVAAVAFLFLTFSGSLDVFRTASGRPDMIIHSTEEILFAEQMAAVLPERAIVVCAPVHNSPLMLTGRTAFMNYPGFLWTNGLPYADREAEVRAIYEGHPSASAILEKHRLRYVVLGAQERYWAEEQGIKIDRAFFARYPVIAKQGEYRLYRLPQRKNSAQNGTKPAVPSYNE
ncbi:MAG: hypothetical protein SFU56_05070 [Capsulimonadales bacterium]|nr:hypothetical protein [Capsulimonadales bacterium]